MKKFKFILLSFILSFMGLNLFADNAYSKTPINMKISKEVLNIVFSQKFIVAEKEVNKDYPGSILGSFYSYKSTSSGNNVEVELIQYGQYIGKIILNISSPLRGSYISEASFSKDPISEDYRKEEKIQPPFMNVLLKSKDFKELMSEEGWNKKIGNFELSMITWGQENSMDFKVSFVVLEYIHSPGFLTEVKTKQLGEVHASIHMGSMVDGLDTVKDLSYEEFNY